MDTLSTSNDIVISFLNGEAEASFGDLSFKEDEFFYRNKMVAKRSKDGEVLLGSSTDFSEEVNDSFIFNLASKGKKFSRVGSFARLLSASDRVEDLRKGNFETLNLVSKVYGFEIGEVDIGIYEKKRNIESQIKEQETKVWNFFRAKQNEIAARAAAAELAAKEEKTREAIIAWDEGKPAGNAMIEGAGGGTRLRLNKSNGRVSGLYSTTGHRVAITTFRSAFNKIAPYLYGAASDGLTPYQKDRLKTRDGVNVGSVRDYSIHFSEKQAIMGCQRVSHAELTRIATLLEWPTDGSLVPTAALTPAAA